MAATGERSAPREGAERANPGARRPASGPRQRQPSRKGCLMHIHSLKRAALAACVVVAAAAPQAVAATVPAELRVEGGGGQDLTHGWTYFSDSATLTTDTAEPCGGKGQNVTLDGANALSIVEHARRQNTRLDPLRVSDEFDFGLLVCGIGAFTSSDSRFWTYKVNHVAPEVAAEQYALKPGDDVLWAFQDLNA